MAPRMLLPGHRAVFITAALVAVVAALLLIITDRPSGVRRQYRQSALWCLQWYSSADDLVTVVDQSINKALVAELLQASRINRHC